MIRQHRHFIVRARISSPPKNADVLNIWLRKVIEEVGMKVVGGPLAYYSNDEGNKGFTSIAILDFSHIAAHLWDEETPNLLEFDLFSCKEFSPGTILDMIDEAFGLISYDHMFINRDDLETVKEKVA